MGTGSKKSGGEDDGKEAIVFGGRKFNPVA